MIKTIKIDDKYKHKYIKVRARSCSTCGAVSQWVEKKIYVDCEAKSLKLYPENRMTFYKNDDKQFFLYSPEIINNEQCFYYFYEVSAVEFKEVTKKSNFSKTAKINIDNFASVGLKNIYFSIRAFCRYSNTWKSEQLNVLFSVDQEILYTPYLFLSTENKSFYDVLHIEDYLRLCIPAIAENTKLKYTIDGSDPRKSSTEYGEVNGDYIETKISFTKEGEYLLRAVSTVNGKYSDEKRIKIIVRDITVIQTEGFAVSVDGTNNYILGDK